MNKVASQMLAKAQEFIKENPELVRNTLLAGGIGALSGSLVSDTPANKDEPASARVGRRLRNALVGAAITGGSAALLMNAGKNIGSAKLTVQKTPEEKVDETLSAIPAVMTNPLTLTGAAGTSALGSWVSDIKGRHNLAASYLKEMGLLSGAEDMDGPLSEAAKSVASKKLRKQLGESWDNKLEKLYEHVGGKDSFIKQLDMAGVDGRQALLKRVEALSQGRDLVSKVHQAQQALNAATEPAAQQAAQDALDAAIKSLDDFSAKTGWAKTMNFGDELQTLDKVLPGASTSTTGLSKWKKGLRWAQQRLRRHPRGALFSTLVPAAIGGAGYLLSPDDDKA